MNIYQSICEIIVDNDIPISGKCFVWDFFDEYTRCKYYIQWYSTLNYYVYVSQENNLFLENRCGKIIK